MKVKITQSHPVRYLGTLYQKGDELEVDEQTANWLLESNRAIEISPKTNANLLTAEEREQQKIEREKKILTAVKKLLEAEPNQTPTCEKVKIEAGLSSNVSGAERDAAVAKLAEKQGE